MADMRAYLPVVGQPCSFYHEGGKADKRWVIGWRYGIVVKIERARIRVEIPVQRWEYDPIKRKYNALANERVWVPATDVNEAGDTIYHGPKAVEVYRERQEEKAEEQAKTDRKLRRVRRTS